MAGHQIIIGGIENLNLYDLTFVSIEIVEVDEAIHLGCLAGRAADQNPIVVLRWSLDEDPDGATHEGLEFLS